MVTDPDFSREQRILNLAVKLQTGEATRDEMLQAADSLSFAAGERLRLEQRAQALEKALAFFMRVMKHFDFDSDIDDYLSWKVLQAPFDSPIRFYVSYGDVEITPTNLPVLEQAFADVAACDEVSSYWGLVLFTLRTSATDFHRWGSTRPSKELLEHVPAAAMHLFNEAGPAQ